MYTLDFWKWWRWLDDWRGNLRWDNWVEKMKICEMQVRNKNEPHYPVLQICINKISIDLLLSSPLEKGNTKIWFYLCLSPFTYSHLLWWGPNLSWKKTFAQFSSRLGCSALDLLERCCLCIHFCVLWSSVPSKKFFLKDYPPLIIRTLQHVTLQKRNGMYMNDSGYLL